MATLVAEPQRGPLKGLMDAFEKTLLPALRVEEFTDMYAQTLTYGLFAAKVAGGAGAPLSRGTAAEFLPPTNPFLRKLFWHLAGPDIPEQVSWVIDDLIRLLNAVDLEAVLADFGKGCLEKDPVVHGPRQWRGGRRHPRAIPAGRRECQSSAPTSLQR